MSMDGVALRMLERIERLERLVERIGTGEVPLLPTVGRVYNSADTSLADNTITTLNFDTERFDVGASHDLVSDNTKLTCAVAGRYWLHAQLEFVANATGIRQGLLWLNATTYIGMTLVPSAGAALRTVVPVSTFYTLAVGDFVQARARQTSGGALNVSASSAYSPEFMWFRVSN